MEFIDTFIQSNGIEGDLVKLLKGEDVTPPEGVEVADYHASLLEGYEKSRVDLFKVKHAEAMIDEAVKEKLKDSYQATVNPIRNKIVKLFDIQLEDKNADVKDILEKVYAKQSTLLEEAGKKVNPDTSALTTQINELKASLTRNTTEFEDYKTKSAQDIAAAVAKARTDSESMIVEMMYGDVFASIEPKLMAQKRSFYKVMKTELIDHGYKLVIEKNKNGSDSLVIKSASGTDAMNLSKTKTVVDPAEVMLEIATKREWLKVNNNDRSQGEQFAAGTSGSKSMQTLQGFLSKSK